MVFELHLKRILLTFIVALGRLVTAAEPVDFNRDIRPLLSDRCFGCHGPSTEDRQADLRLDMMDEAEGPFVDRGGYRALIPQDLEGSGVWQRISTTDNDMLMPPPDSHQKPLSLAEKDLIKRWILQGARYDKFWAFIPPRSQSLPSTTDATWSRNRLDPFVLTQIERNGLRPQSEADRRTLIRRTSFDLIGLPPTLAELHRFLADGSETAYERAVDRLLASPHFGEHLTKYWLDLVRFADTSGLHHDHYREMTPYRDWIIRSFNENMPYDQFVTYQLAGDLYENATIDQQVASGFHRLHLVIDAGTALPEESFHRNVIDRVTSFGTAMLGLTLQCANCHDHKYDPLKQTDFYQLYAFFNNIESAPETPGSAIHAPMLQFSTAKQRTDLAQIQHQLDSAKAQLKNLEVKLNELKANIPADQQENSKEIASLTSEIETALQRISERTAVHEELNEIVPVTLVMKERPTVRPTHVRVRGNYDQLGPLVERNTPSFLPPLTFEGPVPSRLDLARWVTAPGNPLVARVTVNRFWQQCFGVGIVKTSEDFGAQGEWPSHPQLLDDLASEFLRTKWNVKQLLRTLVMSATYRQTSHADPLAYSADPENRLLARGTRFRLDSEMIRDQVLLVSRQLVTTMLGKSVKPPQPAGLWKSVSMPSSNTREFTADTGENIFRRSVYTFWKRGMPPPQMTILDAPTRESCIARRERTNTPLQALLMMNEEQYFSAAQQIAGHLIANPTSSERQRITHAFETMTSQIPDEEELAAISMGLATLKTVYEKDRAALQQLTSNWELLDDHQRVELAAYTIMVNTLLNLDITKTRE